MMVRRWLSALALVLAAAGAARADQTDPQLDPLFDQLLRATNPAEAANIEETIWEIWSDPGDRPPAVGQMMNLARIATATGNLGEAESILDVVVEQAPDFAEALNQRATVRYMRGNITGSIEDIDRTLALEPRHFGALSGLGLCYVAQGQLQQALDAFERALAIDPLMASARANAEALRRELEGDPI